MFEKTKSRTGFSWGVVERETEISFITVVSQVQFPPFVITLTWLQSPPWSRYTSWTSHSHLTPPWHLPGWSFPLPVCQVHLGRWCQVHTGLFSQEKEECSTDIRSEVLLLRRMLSYKGFRNGSCRTVVRNIYHSFKKARDCNPKE